MIQRVQSVYLLLITILMSFLLMIPYADLSLADNQMLLFRAHAIKLLAAGEVITLYKSTIPLVILVLIIGILSFWTIFLYNRRIIQIRISLINVVLILVLIALMLYYYVTTKIAVAEDYFSFRMSMIIPVLSLIFCIMAIRAIKHDEFLVNSYKRIR